MNRLVSLVVGAAVLIAWRSGARACDAAYNEPHTVDTSMQATDQTPPTLPAIPTPQLHYAEDSSGCGGSKCGDFTHIAIQALATDDTTLAGRIGHRFMLESGTAQGVNLPTTPIEPIAGVIRIGFDPNAAALDFTLQVVAIDLAGNESAPESVRINDDSGHACAIGQGRRSPTAWTGLLALLAVAALRRRRCSLF